jgi:hypothetical protein
MRETQLDILHTPQVDVALPILKKLRKARALDNLQTSKAETGNFNTVRPAIETELPMRL